MPAPRRPRLPAGGAGLRRGLTPLAAPGSPGPCSSTVPSGRAPRATSEERAWRPRLTRRSFRHPWVEPEVQEVGEQVEEDHGEGEEEERRLFYVAVTRARNKLILSYAGIRTIFGSQEVNVPSEFIYDIDDADLENAEGGSWNDEQDYGRGKKEYLIDF